METVKIEIPVSVQDNTGALNGITAKLNNMAQAAEKVNKIMLGGGIKKSGLEKSMESLNRTLGKPHALEITAHNNASQAISEVEDAASRLSGTSVIIDINAENNATGVMADVQDSVATTDGSTANVEAYGEDNASDTMVDVQDSVAVTDGSTANVEAYGEDNATDVMADVQDSVAVTDGSTANVEAYGEDNASDVMADVQDSVARTDGSTANVEAYGHDNASDVMADVQDSVARTDGSTANVEVYGEDNATEVINSVEDALSALDGSTATVSIEAADNTGLGGQGGVSLPGIGSLSGGGSFSGGGFSGGGFSGGGSIPGLASAGAGYAAMKGGILGAAGFAGLSLGIGSAANSFKDFEYSMSEVRAISGATDEQFDRLTAAAKQTGATTKFTATESAEALKYMAMAGWEPDEMEAGLSGIVNLAAASGKSIGNASDIVTDALTAFGMSANDSDRFADVLAQASASANTNVSEMGEAFKYVGAAAGAMNYSIEDTALAIGLMSNAGVHASMAGTALRRSILGLAAPTTKVQAAMDKYGISLTKDSGEAKSLLEVMGDLRESLGGLEETEQMAAAKDLFGQQASTGMLAIINASEEDWNGLIENLENAEGAAGRMAATMLDNMQGSLTLLGSAFEGVQNTLGERLSPYIREIADSITAEMPSVSEAITNTFDSIEEAFQTDGLSGVADEIGDIIGNIAGSIEGRSEEAVSAATEFMTSLFQSISEPENAEQISSTAASIVTSLGTSFAELSGEYGTAALSLISGFTQSLADNEAGTKIVESITQSLSNVGNWFDENGEDFGEVAGELIDQLASGIETNSDKMGEAAAKIITNLGTGFASNAGEFGEAALSLVDGLVTGLGDNEAGTKIVEAITNSLSDVGNWFAENGDDLNTAAGELIDQLANGIETNSDKMGDAAAKIITNIGTGFASNAGEFGEAALFLVDGLVSGLAENEAGTKIVEAISQSLSDVGNWFDENGDGLNTAAGELIDQLADGIEANSDNMGGAAAKIVTNLGTSFASNAGEFVTAAGSLIDGLVTGLGDNEAGTKIADAITESLSDIGNWFGENGGDFGAAAGELVSQLVTGITSNSGAIIGAGIQIVSGLAQGLAQGIGVLVGQAPSIILDLVGGILQNIPMLFQAGVELIQALKDGILSAGEGLGDFLNDMLTIEPIELNSEINYDNPGGEIMEALQVSMEDTGSAFASLDSDAQAFFASLANGETTVSDLDAAIQEMDPSDLDFMAANTALQTFIEEVNALHEAGVGAQNSAEDTASAIEATGEAAESGADMVESAMERVMDAANMDTDNSGLEGTIDSLNEMAEQAAETGEAVESALDIDLADSLGGLTGDTLSALLNSEDMAATAEEINSAMQTVAEGLSESASQMESAVSESMSSMSESLSSAQDAFTNMQTAAETAMSQIGTSMTGMVKDIQSAFSSIGIKMGEAEVEVDTAQTGAAIQSALRQAISSSGSHVEEVTAEGMTIKLGNVDIDPSSAAQQIAEALGTTVEELAASAGTTEAEIEAEGKIVISSAHYDTSSIEEAADEEPDIGEKQATASLSIEFSEVDADYESVVSEVGENVTSAFSGQSFPADAAVEVTLTQTNNAAQIYAECDSQIQGTFAAGFTATADVAITLNWSITNPTASISVSTSGTTATATIAGAAANGAYIDEAALILAGEAGPEFIIPVGANKRNRGMELWMEAGSALGVPGFADGGIVGGIPVDDYSDGEGFTWKAGDYSSDTASGSSGGNSDGVVLQVNMSPQFNMNGADENTVLAWIRANMDELTDEFGEKLADMLAESYENKPAV